MGSRWLSLRGTYFLLSRMPVAILLQWNFLQSEESPPPTHSTPYGAPEEAQQNPCARCVLFKRGRIQELVGFDFF